MRGVFPKPSWISFSVVLLYLSLMSRTGYTTTGQSKEIWLVNIATPHTLQKSTFEIDLLSRYTNYRFPDPRSEVMDFLLTTNYGLTQHLTVSLTAPFSWRSSAATNLNGIKDLAILLRYRLIAADEFSLTVGQNISLPTGEKDNLLGGGKVNMQLNVFAGYQIGRLGFLGHIGYGQTDYIESGIIFGPNGSVNSPTGVIRNEQAIRFSGGLAFDMQRIVIITEVAGQAIPDFEDQDYSFQIGGIINLKSFRLKASGGLGFPRRANQGSNTTDVTASLGMSYQLSF